MNRPRAGCFFWRPNKQNLRRSRGSKSSLCSSCRICLCLGQRLKDWCLLDEHCSFVGDALPVAIDCGVHTCAESPARRASHRDVWDAQGKGGQTPGCAPSRNTCAQMFLIGFPSYSGLDLSSSFCSGLQNMMEQLQLGRLGWAPA